MIGLPFVYALTGIMFFAFAVLGAADRTNARRWLNGGFWALLAASFLVGDRLGDAANGMLVLALVGLATIGIGHGAGNKVPPRHRRLTGPGYRLILPALAVPLVALAGTIMFPHLDGLVDPNQATLVALACGVLVGLALCGVWFRPSPAAPLEEGRRLMDAIGWAALLPPMLAALGALFATAGVGEALGRLIGAALPSGGLVAAVLAYGIGMALLTVLMGNAFAAFPVMMAAVGLPLLIGRAHGNAAAIASIGMLTGFCGTLLTPMAANFNLVPAALLDLPDRYGVIRAQAPTALLLLGANLILLWWLAFPR